MHWCAIQKSWPRGSGRAAGSGGRSAPTLPAEEIDTSLGRTLNDGSGSAGGPRVESGRLPDSSSSEGKEDFAAGGRKGHASRVRPTSGILRAISGFFFAIHEYFNRGFEKIRDCYVAALRWCLSDRGLVFAGMSGVVLISLCLVPFLGRDFFPAVDAGQFRLHEGTQVDVKLLESPKPVGSLAQSSSRR